MNNIDIDEIIYGEEIPMPCTIKELRWQPGRCKICGEVFDVLTYYHIGLHGYTNLNKFIKDGHVEFDFERKKRKGANKDNRT